jgi:hypothetical protein
MSERITTFRAVDFNRGGLRVTRNLPSVWVVDALGRRLIFRRYSRHAYLIAFGRVVFDWWPGDKDDRLRIFNRIVMR